MATVSQSWAVGRAARAARPKGEPVLSRLARLAGRTLPTWRRFRAAVLQCAGLGLISFALFHLHLVAGLVASGVSLLLIEWAGRDA